MKKFYSLLIALMTFTLAVVAQTAPQKINYQTVVRNALGVPVINQNVSLRFSSAVDGNSSKKIAYTYPDRAALHCRLIQPKENILFSNSYHRPVFYPGVLCKRQGNKAGKIDSLFNGDRSEPSRRRGLFYPVQRWPKQ